MVAGGMAGGGGTVASDPRWLAAGAAGLLSSVLALWAFRGMPLGAAAMWLIPLPLFVAGLGFGPAALLAGVAIATLVLTLSATNLAIGVFLSAFGLPVAVLGLAWAARRGELSASFALLGLVPAGGILAAALALSGSEGGLEGAMRQAAETALARMGLPAGGGLVDELVRVKAAAIGFWLSIALLANAALAGRIVARLGLAPAPQWREARLPRLYPALPAAAALVWLLMAGEGDAVPLSVTLALLVPVFLLGLSAVHRRTQGLRGRGMLLGLLYGLLIILTVPTAMFAAGFGLYDHWARRAAPPTTT